MMNFRRNVSLLLMISSILLVQCVQSTGEINPNDEIINKKKTGNKTLPIKLERIKEWPHNKKQFRVYFSIGNNLHPRIEGILEIANDWSPDDQVLFVRAYSKGASDIRVSFHGGVWSKIGAEADDYYKITTMELAFLKGHKTISRLAKAKILHEFGHALGLVHGHQLRTSPITSWNIPYILSKNKGKTKDWITKNYMLRYRPMSRVEQFFDDSSIMNYEIPDLFTLNGRRINKHFKLSDGDKRIAKQLYSYNPQ